MSKYQITISSSSDHNIIILSNSTNSQFSVTKEHDMDESSVCKLSNMEQSGRCCNSTHQIVTDSSELGNFDSSKSSGTVEDNCIKINDPITAIHECMNKTGSSDEDSTANGSNLLSEEVYAATGAFVPYHVVMEKPISRSNRNIRAGASETFCLRAGSETDQVGEPSSSSSSSRHSQLHDLVSLNLHDVVTNYVSSPQFSVVEQCGCSDHRWPISKAKYRIFTGARVSCLGVIEGNPEDGLASALIAAGDFLYAGSASKNVIAVWARNNVLGGCCAYKLGHGENGAVKALMVVERSNILISAHQDRKIRVWKRSLQRYKAAAAAQNQVASGSTKAEFYEHYKLLATMPTAENYLRTFFSAGGGGGASGTKKFVQVRRHHKRLWIQHADTISALAVSTKYGLIYSASWDRSIKVWRLWDFKCVESLDNAHDDAVNALAVSADGFLYSASADAKIRVWARMPAFEGSSSKLSRVRSAGSSFSAPSTVNNEKKKYIKHTLVATLEAHKSGVNAIALNWDGSLLYSGACDKAIIVWEREESAEHMSVAGALRGHSRSVLCLAALTASSSSSTPELDSNSKQDNNSMSHLQGVLCSGSADKTIRVWRRMTAAHYGETGGAFAADAAAGGAKIRKLGTLHCCLAVLDGHRGPIKCLALSYANYNNIRRAPAPPPDDTDSILNVDDDNRQAGLLLYSGTAQHEIRIWSISLRHAFHRMQL